MYLASFSTTLGRTLRRSCQNFQRNVCVRSFDSKLYLHISQIVLFDMTKQNDARGAYKHRRFTTIWCSRVRARPSHRRPFCRTTPWVRQIHLIVTLLHTTKNALRFFIYLGGAVAGIMVLKSSRLNHQKSVILFGYGGSLMWMGLVLGGEVSAGIRRASL
jgi:hypothetical protein